MHETMRRRKCGDLIYYTCDRLPVRHAFTTRLGGVSTGDCAGLNLGFGRGDDPAAVRENYARLTGALGMPLPRVTLTQQIHADHVAVVGEQAVGTGLHQPMDWGADALVTALPDTPLAGFYADCVVTLLYDPTAQVCGVCHAGWRGTALEILPKTVQRMADALGACRETMLAVIGPSICAACYETDADVPEAMLAQMGDRAAPFVTRRGAKYHVDLHGLNAMELAAAGLRPEHIIDSGLCTRCMHEEFWSHRYTHGRRGVQAGVICL